MVQKQDRVTDPKGEGDQLTEELLQRLLSCTSPEAYLEKAPIDSRTLAEYLHELLAAHGMKRADVARGSAVNATFVYQVFDGTRQVGRENAIKLAFGMGCNLRETQRLLRHAGVSELWCKSRRDAIIIYCIEHGYSLVRCDEELYRLGEDTLVPQEG